MTDFGVIRQKDVQEFSVVARAYLREQQDINRIILWIAAILLCISI